MTTILVFLAVFAAGAVALLATGFPLHRKSAAEPGAPGTGGDPGLAEPDPRLPPVLLPEKVQASDIGRLRFSVALRGYRMDQVDEVLSRLAAALAERDAALDALRGGPRSGETEEPEVRP